VQQRLAWIVIVLIAVVVVYVGAADATSARDAMGRATCTPGIRTMGAAKVRVYCGPAHAEVRVSGKTYSIRNGSCFKTASTLVVNIGIATLANPLSTAPPRTSSFGALIAASRDGTFHAGSSVGVVWTAPGHAYLFTAGSLHLADNRDRGTFSGLFYDRSATGTASGSFSCT
jgi:hypothetical protein